MLSLVTNQLVERAEILMNLRKHLHFYSVILPWLVAKSMIKPLMKLLVIFVTENNTHTDCAPAKMPKMRFKSRPLVWRIEKIPAKIRKYLTIGFPMDFRVSYILIDTDWEILVNNNSESHSAPTKSITNEKNHVKYQPNGQFWNRSKIWIDSSSLFPHASRVTLGLSFAYFVNVLFHLFNFSLFQS